MLKIILFSLIFILLFIAALEDFKTGEVKDLYSISIAMIVLGTLFSIYTNNPLINIKTNILITIIIFVGNYLIYFFTNMAHRNGWGGADVLIISSLTMSLGLYIIFVLLISTSIAAIYGIVKSIYTKEKISNISTRFLPFIFIATIFTTFFIF